MWDKSGTKHEYSWSATRLPRASTTLGRKKTIMKKTTDIEFTRGLLRCHGQSLVNVADELRAAGLEYAAGCVEQSVEYIVDALLTIDGRDAAAEIVVQAQVIALLEGLKADLEKDFS